jgi:para-nitrobenzyl esterase
LSDPVFGESAGGLSTLSQLVSPGARGLFARAIVESGTYSLTQTPLATAESAGAALAAQVGCASNTAACLRSVPASTLLAKESAAGYTPNVDGAVLPQSIGPALATGQFSHVPVMIGTNHDEWRLFVALDQLIGGPPVSAVNYPTEINDTVGGGLSAAAVAAIAAQYPLSDYSSPSVALGAPAPSVSPPLTG